MTEEIKTDFLLVGAGIAGILLASKLAVSGKNEPRWGECQVDRLRHTRAPQ